MDELHHQAARWLVDHFDIILLPTFETSEMARRGARKLRSKSVRSMLTYAHYRFRQYSGLESLAVRQRRDSGQRSVHQQDVQLEWRDHPNLGGRRVVAGSDGVRVNRDINGARGIFLRALGDTPALRDVAEGRIGDYAVSVS